MKVNKGDKKKLKYIELSKAKIQDTRNIVISAASQGGYTMSQQLEVQEGNKLTTVFLKGSMIIDDLQGLYNLRDACNVAIQKAEEINGLEGDDGEDWDR